jgi:hypothetical protein
MRDVLTALDMLMKTPAEGDVEELVPATDRKNWNISLQSIS